MSVSWNNIRSQIGTNVYHNRMSQRKSITEVSEEAGLTFETVSGIECYTRETVTEKELNALAGALGVSRDDLIGDHRKPLTGSRDPEKVTKVMSPEERIRYGRKLAQKLKH